MNRRQFPREKRKRAVSSTEPPFEAFIPPYYVDALVSKMRVVQALAEETLEDTRLKAETYNQFRLIQAYSRTKACADAWTAVYFGIRPPGNDPGARYYDVLSVIDRGDREWIERTRAPWFKLAQEEARK